MTNIRRAPRPADNFAQIHNSALEDERLSWRARGLLAYLLSRPPEWTTTSERLSALGKEGRDAVRSALKELEQYGYLRRSRWRNPQSRSWEWEHWITDQPGTLPDTSDGFSGDGISGVGNPVPINNTELNNTKEPPPSSSSSSPSVTREDDDFQRFINSHPKVERPKVVRAAWELAITKVPAATIITAARGYARQVKAEGKDPQFVATATNWLNEERWNDKLPPAPVTDAPGNRNWAHQAGQ